MYTREMVLKNAVLRVNCVMQVPGAGGSSQQGSQERETSSESTFLIAFPRQQKSPKESTAIKKKGWGQGTRDCPPLAGNLMSLSSFGATGPRKGTELGGILRGKEN